MLTLAELLALAGPLPRFTRSLLLSTRADQVEVEEAIECWLVDQGIGVGADSVLPRHVLTIDVQDLTDRVLAELAPKPAAKARCCDSWQGATVPHPGRLELALGRAMETIGPDLVFGGER